MMGSQLQLNLALAPIADTDRSGTNAAELRLGYICAGASLAPLPSQDIVFK